MLHNLTVRDIVLIDQADIELGPGLSVLTGETGAGKSILIDALALLLGARGDSSLVRAGAKRGEVLGIFDVEQNHVARSVAADGGFEIDGPIVLKRIQFSDGKSRAFINDMPCSVGLLRALGSALVEIHGQHDDRAMVDSRTHQTLLDAFGQLEPDVAEVAERYNALKSADRAVSELEDRVTAAEEQADFLSAAVDELEILAPEIGEEAELADRRRFLMQAGKISTELNAALEGIAGEASPIPNLSGLLRQLERKSAEMPGLLEDAIEPLSRALDELELGSEALAIAVREAEFDPNELERVEDRLFAIRSAARKYQVSPEDLTATAAEFAVQLDALATGREQLETLRVQLSEMEQRYDRAADNLTRKRQTAAESLKIAVNGELPKLKLDTAEFHVFHEIDEGRVAAIGRDRIAFHIRTNPGSPFGPLMKIASGGELSRILLAIKAVLSDRGTAPTLIFDEVDTGAGGAVASAIGRRLMELAKKMQVICVTHAPQVAALADAHRLITKSQDQDAGQFATRISEVTDSARIEEIARMLAGDRITAEARAAANRLVTEKPADPDQARKGVA